MTERVCAYCGEAFEVATTGRPPKYCTPKCRVYAGREKRKAAKAAKVDTETAAVVTGEVLPAVQTTTETLPAIREERPNPVGAYLASLASKNSRRRMLNALQNAADVFGCDVAVIPWADVLPSHLEAMRAAILQDKSRASANLALTACKQVLRRAWRDYGMIDADRYMRVKDVEGVPSKGATVLTGRMITDGEIVAMSRVCSEDRSPVGQRDVALLAVAVSGGLRRTELATLTLEDLADDGDVITLTVLGKGSKLREVPLTNGAADALRSWLGVRGDAPGFVFWSGRKGGRVNKDSGMSAQSVYDVLLRRARQAGVSEKLTPHDFRRTYISNGLDVTDAVTMAALAGHANVTTTARYDRRGERAKRKAAESLHFPYFAPEKLV